MDWNHGVSGLICRGQFFFVHVNLSCYKASRLEPPKGAGVTGGGDSRGELAQLEEIGQGASGGINGIGSLIIGSWMPRNLNW